MISGTPKLRFPLAAIVLIALATGCQVAQRQAPDRVNPTPILSDAAMDQRVWPAMPAVYPNFSSTAGPNEMIFDPKGPSQFCGFDETGIFITDVVLLPLAMSTTSPVAQLEATSLYVPSSYTGNPPSVPVRGNDLSGGPGTAFTSAPGRTAPFSNP